MSDPETGRSRETRLHLLFGWSCLVVFLLLGAVLEALHGLKLGFYLDVGNETRRLMWTLAHAHGTLVALVNIAFALCLHRTHLEGRRLQLASRSLIGAGVLLPAGFFLGGIDVYGGDPGLGVLLVPAGALLLIAGALLVALATRSLPGSPE
jgi:fumarate reductase subunit D